MKLFDQLFPTEQADAEMTDLNRVDTIRNDQELRMELDKCLPGLKPFKTTSGIMMST